MGPDLKGCFIDKLAFGVMTSSQGQMQLSKNPFQRNSKISQKQFFFFPRKFNFERFLVLRHFAQFLHQIKTLFLSPQT